MIWLYNTMDTRFLNMKCIWYMYIFINYLKYWYMCMCIVIVYHGINAEPSPPLTARVCESTPIYQLLLCWNSQMHNYLLVNYNLLYFWTILPFLFQICEEWRSYESEFDFSLSEVGLSKADLVRSKNYKTSKTEKNGDGKKFDFLNSNCTHSSL